MAAAALDEAARQRAKEGEAVRQRAKDRPVFKLTGVAPPELGLFADAVGQWLAGRRKAP